MRILGLAVVSTLSIGLFVLPVMAEQLTGTGTRIENDVIGTTKHWGRSLSMPRDGKVIRVMGGTYGFQILDEQAGVVGDFLFPEQAIGFSLPAGDYEVIPSVCRIHRHHHVEVTVEY